MSRDLLEADTGPLALDELREALGVESSVVIEYVELGLVGPQPELPDRWRFTASQVARLSRTLRIAHDLELHAAAAALLVDLLEERERMQRRIACLERLVGE